MTAVEKLKEAHRPIPTECASCGAAWPCPTVRALRETGDPHEAAALMDEWNAEKHG